MGSLPYDQTSSFLPSAESGDVDNASFGVLYSDRPVLLMNSVLIKKDWVFTSETIAISRREARSEKWIDVSGQDNNVKWWQETVFSPSQSGMVKAGQTLVLAAFPYSQAQCDSSMFKAGLKKEKDRRSHAGDHRFSNVQEFFSWIQSHRQDYWEKGNYVVARIDCPTPMRDGKMVQRRPRSTDNPRLVFGLIHGKFEKAVSDLFRNDKAIELLQRTVEGTLGFWNKTAVKRMKAIPKLSDDIKDAAPVLLDLAIRLSFAGPSKDSEKWFGRPVMDLADQIYRNLINDHNRVDNNRRKRQKNSDFADM